MIFQYDLFLPVVIIIWGLNRLKIEKEHYPLMFVLHLVAVPILEKKSNNLLELIHKVTKMNKVMMHRAILNSIFQKNRMDKNSATERLISIKCPRSISTRPRNTLTSINLPCKVVVKAKKKRNIRRIYKIETLINTTHRSQLTSCNKKKRETTNNTTLSYWKIK